MLRLRLIWVRKAGAWGAPESPRQASRGRFDRLHEKDDCSIHYHDQNQEPWRENMA